MKILVDENIPAARQAFAQFGEVVRVAGRSLNGSEGRALVEGAQALMVRSVTRVDQALLAGSDIKFVGSATIGADHLDVAYLQQQGIAWATAPGCNANSVVDYVLSAICVCGDLLERLLAGVRVGIIGHGNVGSRLAGRFQALGIDCRAYDPLLPQQGILTELDALWDCPLLCLHAPLTRSGSFPSFHMLSCQQLCQLPQNAVIISAGRGEVVATEVLLQLKAKRPDIQLILDVWEPEPAIPLALLAQALLATPHIAGYSADGKINGTLQIAEALANSLGRDWRDDEIQGFLGDAPEVRLNAGVPADLIREAVLAVYDIREDDQRLRESLAGLEDERARGAAFDTLRKNYPRRRELASTKFVLAAEDQVLINCLSAVQARR